MTVVTAGGPQQLADQRQTPSITTAQAAGPRRRGGDPAGRLGSPGAPSAAVSARPVMAHQARPHRRVPSVVAHRLRPSVASYSAARSGASHQARAIRRGAEPSVAGPRRARHCHSRPMCLQHSATADRGTSCGHAREKPPRVRRHGRHAHRDGRYRSPSPNRAADRSCRRAAARRRSRPGAGAGGASGEVLRRSSRGLRVALDDLVQLAAVQPDAAALRAVVDLDALAIGHHQIHLAMRAGHASLGHASSGACQLGACHPGACHPGPPAAGFDALSLMRMLPVRDAPGTSTDVLDDGPAPLVSRLTHHSPRSARIAIDVQTVLRG